MKRLTILSICVLALTVTGCATPKHNYSAAVIETKTRPSPDPKVAKPGDVVLSAAKRKEHETLYLKEPIQVGIAYTLSKGHYTKEGDDAKAEYFYPAGGSDAGSVDKALLADPWKSVMLPKAGGRVCVVTIFHAVACALTTQYDRSKQIIPIEDAYEKALVFLRAEAGKFVLGYRESRNGVLIPGGSREMTYDVAATKVVDLGSLRVEILSVTPEALTYRISEVY